MIFDSTAMKKLALLPVAFVLLFVIAFAVGVVPVSAQDFTVETIPTSITTTAQLLTRITTILNWVFTIFIIVSVFFIIMAAFQFVTAGDNSEAISGARQKLIWSVVGIVVALLARAIPEVIRNILI